MPASPVIGAVRGISVSSAKSCRDAFSRLGTRNCRIKSPAAKTWRLAETQECVSTGGPRGLSFIGAVRGISVSSAKSCRDAFSRLGTRDCRMKSPVAKTWRLAETQECVSTGFLRVCLLRLGVVWFVETWRAASPVIGAVRGGISVSSAKSCRDAFLRLGTRDCRIKSPVAKTWQLAETQECVSTGRWVSRGLSFASWRCLAAWGDARMRLYRGFRVV